MDKKANLLGLLDAIFELFSVAVAVWSLRESKTCGHASYHLIRWRDIRVCACLINFMSVLARYIPWFIKDLGISIIGEVSALHTLTVLFDVNIKQECYTSLVENLDVGNVKCLKYSLSKVLGIGIVFGGSIMKVPQILLSK